MISEKVIMDKVRAYVASPIGKKAIKKKLGIDYDPKQDTIALSQINAIAEKARQILHKHIAAVIASIALEDIIVGVPQIIKDSEIKISLSFREDALFRKSLDPIKFPLGVEDIVLHFAKGWRANGAVFGSWHGTDTWSRRAKSGDSFLQEALIEINKSIKTTAIAELKGDYANS